MKMSGIFDKLSESLDEKVFTPELKASLEESFNSAVETKAQEIADTKIEEEIETLNVKSEEHIDYLNEQAEEYKEKIQTEMTESVDKYLDRVVEEFMQETNEKLQESIVKEKYELVIEAFESALIALGVDVSRIMEAKDETSTEAELKEKTEKYDSLIEENISLKEENENLLKMGIINEMKADLSLVEAEKFEKLAALVECEKEEMLEKFEVIKENIKASESTEVEINENTDEIDSKCSFKHLI